MITRFILKLIKFYKKNISLVLPRILMVNNVCRFFPTCSDYTYQAISKYGLINGALLGVKRIIKCNPLSKGGLDPLN